MAKIKPKKKCASCENYFIITNYNRKYCDECQKKHHTNNYKKSGKNAV